MKFINKKEYAKDLVPRINSVSSVGDVSIVMNRDILIPKSYANFNDKVIKVTVRNKLNRYLKGRELSIYNDEEEIRFNWTITNFNSRRFDIKLEFEDPLIISNGVSLQILTRIAI